MTRRQFALSLALAIWAGPRALVALIEEKRKEALIIAQLRYQAQAAIRALSGEYLGLVDAMYSTSVHSLSTETMSDWNVRLDGAV